MLSERPPEISEMKTIEFTPKEFKSILESDKFARALQISSQETKKSGYETGFDIYCNENKNIYFGEVTRGCTDSIGFGGGGSHNIILDEMDEREILDASYIESERFGNLFSFHFHPSSGGIIIPSEADISHFTNRETRPGVMGVGQVDKKGNVDILLVNTPLKEISPIILEGYSYDVPSKSSYQHDIQRFLEEFNLNSLVISLQKNGKRRFILDENSGKLILLGLNKIKVNLKDPENDHD